MRLAAVFIDGENINHKYMDKIYSYINLNKLSIIESNVYCDFSMEHSKIWEKHCFKYNISPKHVFTRKNKKKNTSDIVMSLDCISFIENITNKNIENIVLCSGDTDFRYVANYCKRKNKTVYGISTNELATSETFNDTYDYSYIINDNEYNMIVEENDNNISNNNIIKDNTKPIWCKEQEKGVNIESIETIKDRVIGYFCTNTQMPINIGLLKEQILEWYPNFNNKNYGCKKFSIFVEKYMNDYFVIKEQKIYMK